MIIYNNEYNHIKWYDSFTFYLSKKFDSIKKKFFL